MPVYRTLLAAGLSLALTAVSRAAVVFATNPTGPLDAADSMTVGTPFILTTAPVTIGALGLFDLYGDGLAAAHTVGIYDAAQTLLGSVTIPAGTAADLHDGTRWVNLATPLSLSPGQTYMLAASFEATPEAGYAASSSGEITIASDFALGSGFYYLEGPGLNFPTVTGTSNYYLFGANMEVLAAPEPAPLLPALVLTGCALLMRRRGKSPV